MPASEPKKLPGIFISYRRSDNPDAVGRIYDRLVSEFGKARVFKDVDSIPLGQDFRGHLNDIVGNCSAVLAVIGPKWIDIRNEEGKRRLEDPDDFVRIELEAALARSVPVVPVLVGHAPMPPGGQLPSSLASLSFRQSIEVRPDPDFHHDSTRLVAALRGILDPNAPVVETADGPHVGPVALTANAKLRRRLKWMGALAGAAVLGMAAMALPVVKHLQEMPPAETRVDIVTPPTVSPFQFELSPDGRQIVFIADDGGVQRLWLRSLAAATAQPLPGTDGASWPFWSPDGRSLGFFADNTLKRLELSGGAPRTLTSLRANPLGGTWNADGVILFGQEHVGIPLMRIAATGGVATRVLQANTELAVFAVPRFLPDGHHFLFGSQGGTARGVFLGSLDGGEPVQLATDTGRPAYLPSGWLLWRAAGVLTAQRLDVEKAMLVGEPTTLAEGVVGLSVSTTGSIAYRVEGARNRRQLAWVDRSGAMQAIGESGEWLNAPRVAPDGRRVAWSNSAQGNEDIWIQDGARISRMTFDPLEDDYPVWSPDGTRVVFKSARTGSGDLYQKLANGAGADERLVTSERNEFPTSWSADGRFLMYFSASSTDGTDLWVLPMTGDRKPFLFLKTSFNEHWGQFSPDGRWVAYQSNEAGRDEVFVRPFDSRAVAEGDARPGAEEGRWQVSTAGGIHPLWSPDGKELYFIDPKGVMMAAPVSANESAFVPGVPIPLFQSNIVGGGIESQVGRQYDVARDGRFLINVRSAEGVVAPITLIQNWNPDAGK